MGAESTPSRAVLIVDDDRALRHALSALLTEAGHHIESAGDGPEALALFAIVRSILSCSISVCRA
jgi:CheY-like chemotaxis protein